MSRIIALVILAACAVAPHLALAVTIDTVLVGNAGNRSDPVFELGSVAYSYRIGATEVTNAQYVEFLNAVAASDPYLLYNTSMYSDPAGGIRRSGTTGNFVYSITDDFVGHGYAGSDYTYADKPVNFVNWFDVIRFINWLHNGQPSGAQGPLTTEDGAYHLFGATQSPGLIVRSPDAKWFLPNADEWYKAAAYDGDADVYYVYPTGTNTEPDNNYPTSDSGNSANHIDHGFTTGISGLPYTDAGAYTLSSSPYGTFDQGGNVWEWTEEKVGGYNRRIQGGSAYNSDVRSITRADQPPTWEGSSSIGFRVAAIAIVPEPSTIALAAFGLASLIVCALRRRILCAESR